MEDVKRGRGRPPGTGDDDSEALMMVARLLVADPTIKPTTAMKRVRNARPWRAASDDALIRRWQVKWKAEGNTYLSRVHAERAEAERQRQERAAQQRRQAGSKTAWELMADARAAGHAPGWALQSTMQRYAAEHGVVTRTAGQWLAAAGAMDKTTISRADLLAKSGVFGATMSDAVRRSLEVVNATGIGDAMRKYDTLGRALQGFSAVHVPKLHKGF